MAVAPMRSRAPRRARRIALAIAVTAGANVVTGAISVPGAAAASVADVMAWSPYWEEQPTVTPKALDKFLAHSEQFSELTPFFFVAANGTTITLNSNMTSGASRVQAYHDATIQKGKRLVTTIVDGTAARVMAGILADPLQRTAHVQTIVNFATTGFNGGFDGVDLDYEQFAFADGKATWDATFVAWGLFIQELSDALHAAGKTLAVSVPPIYDSLYGSGSGYWVYNFPQLAQYADLVRVMTYSYSVSSAGPIAPYNWVSASIDAVSAVVPKSKVMMGVAAYGNDWITKVEGSCPTSVTVKKGTLEIDEAAQYAANRGVTIGQATWDTVTHEHHYSYVESFTGPDSSGVAVRCNVYRTVWYPDARAIYDRVLLAQSKDLRGVAIWALGYDDGPTWDAIAAARSGDTSWQPPAGLAPTPRSSIVTAPYPTPIYSAGPLPARYLDTRAGQKTADGLFQAGGRREAESTLAVKIAGRGAVPADAKAITLNVTVLGEGTGYVTVYPCDGPRPGTSNLNVRTGQTISNSVITKLSADGTVCIYNQAPAHLLVDVFNVLPAASFTPLPVPARLVDTRVGEATTDGQYAGIGAMAFGTTLEVQVAGRGGVGTTAKSAVLNVTAVGAATNGYLTVWPCDGPQPATSNVNFTSGAIVPNAVATGLSAKGTVCIYASNATHLVVDAFGVLDPSKFTALYQPARLLETRSGFDTVDGVFNGIGKVDAGVTLEVPIALRGGLPEDPSAVILNVTVDQPELAGFVTVFPCGTARPLVSNVNFAPLQTLPNLVVTKLSASGSICVYAHVKTHIVIDAFGTLSL